MKGMERIEAKEINKRNEMNETNQMKCNEMT